LFAAALPKAGAKKKAPPIRVDATTPGLIGCGGTLRGFYTI